MAGPPDIPGNPDAVKGIVPPRITLPRPIDTGAGSVPPVNTLPRPAAPSPPPASPKDGGGK